MFLVRHVPERVRQDACATLEPAFLGDLKACKAL